MSIATYIASIEASRNTIRNKLVAMGLATSTEKLDALAAAIAEIIDQGAVSVTIREGETYKIPAGYHNGAGTVSGTSGGGSYTLQSKAVTPTKKQQAITPDSGYYGLSDVTVGAIPDNYVDTSDATATESSILAGATAYVDGGKIVGSMPNNGEINLTIDGMTTESVDLPAGYASGGTVSLTDSVENALAAI